MRHALVAILALAPLTMAQTCYNPPEPSCEHVNLTVDALGRTTVNNFNPGQITYDLRVTASVCTSSDCSSYGDFEGETLAPNSLKLYTPDIHATDCDQVYCCSSGGIYRARAELYLYEAGCALEAHVEETSTCQP